MDSRCLQGNKKKDEKDFDGKNKFTDSTFADTSSRKQSSSTQQTFSANSIKDQNDQQGFWQYKRQEQACDSFAMGVSTSTIKREVKDLSQVECYNCHWKGHYSNKCPQNSKVESKN